MNTKNAKYELAVLLKQVKTLDTRLENMMTRYLHLRVQMKEAMTEYGQIVEIEELS